MSVAASGDTVTDAAGSAGIAGADLVVSFDVDGTVWFGDPPGPIAAGLIGALQLSPAVIGSASDRTVLDQRRLWRDVGVEPAFVVLKHRLHTITPEYADRVLVHIGDRFVDEIEAGNAGAIFLHVDMLTVEEWLSPSRVLSTIGAAGLDAARSQRPARSEGTLDGR